MLHYFKPKKAHRQGKGENTSVSNKVAESIPSTARTSSQFPLERIALLQQQHEATCLNRLNPFESADLADGSNPLDSTPQA